MENYPLISVIIPCYKVEKYLPKCVESILCQTYSNLEIWLVDDGSPDRCGDMCDDYAEKDKRIKVIHKENGGLSDARNVAIDQATGEWITFVDSDDIVEPAYIEVLYGLVSKYNCNCSVCILKTFKEGEILYAMRQDSNEEMMTPIESVEQMFYQEKFDNNAPAKLYHRSLFADGIRFPKGKVFEDLATTYKLLLMSNGVAFTDAVLYHYLLRDGSIEGSYSDKKVADAMEVVKCLDENASLFSGIENAFLCRKFSFLMHILLGIPKDNGHFWEIWQKITEIRWLVLNDKKARKKARIAALVSYLGFDMVKFIFSFINRRA